MAGLGRVSMRLPLFLSLLFLFFLLVLMGSLVFPDRALCLQCAGLLCAAETSALMGVLLSFSVHVQLSLSPRIKTTHCSWFCPYFNHPHTIYFTPPHSVRKLYPISCQHLFLYCAQGQSTFNKCEYPRGVWSTACPGVGTGRRGRSNTAQLCAQALSIQYSIHLHCTVVFAKKEPFMTAQSQEGFKNQLCLDPSLLMVMWL